MKKKIVTKIVFILLLTILISSPVSATKYWIGSNTILSIDNLVFINTDSNSRVGIGNPEPTYRLDALTPVANSRAIYAFENGSGVSYGVYGESTTTSIAVSGSALGSSGTNYGGDFTTGSRYGAGIEGRATHTSGTNYGGYFTSESTSGRALYAYNNQDTENAAALYVKTSSGYAGYFNGGLGVKVESGSQMSIGCDTYSGSGGDWYSYTCPSVGGIQYELTGAGCRVTSGTTLFQADYPTSTTSWTCGGHGGNKNIVAICCRIT